MVAVDFGLLLFVSFVTVSLWVVLRLTCVLVAGLICVFCACCVLWGLLFVHAYIYDVFCFSGFLWGMVVWFGFCGFRSYVLVLVGWGFTLGAVMGYYFRRFGVCLGGRCGCTTCVLWFLVGGGFVVLGVCFVTCMHLGRGVAFGFFCWCRVDIIYCMRLCCGFAC